MGQCASKPFSEQPLKRINSRSCSVAPAKQQLVAPLSSFHHDAKDTTLIATAPDAVASDQAPRQELEPDSSVLVLGAPLLQLSDSSFGPHALATTKYTFLLGSVSPGALSLTRAADPADYARLLQQLMTNDGQVCQELERAAAAAGKLALPASTPLQSASSPMQPYTAIVLAFCPAQEGDMQSGLLAMALKVGTWQLHGRTDAAIFIRHIPCVPPTAPAKPPSVAAGGTRRLQKRGLQQQQVQEETQPQQPSAETSLLAQPLARRLVRMLTALDFSPMQLTLCTTSGQVLYQNSSSLAYAGCWSLPGANTSGFAAALLSLQSDALEDLLETVMVQHEPWMRVVQVPITLMHLAPQPSCTVELPPAQPTPPSKGSHSPNGSLIRSHVSFQAGIQNEAAALEAVKPQVSATGHTFATFPTKLGLEQLLESREDVSEAASDGRHSRFPPSKTTSGGAADGLGMAASRPSQAGSAAGYSGAESAGMPSAASASTTRPRRPPRRASGSWLSQALDQQHSDAGDMKTMSGTESQRVSGNKSNPATTKTSLAGTPDASQPVSRNATLTGRVPSRSSLHDRATGSRSFKQMSSIRQTPESGISELDGSLHVTPERESVTPRLTGAGGDSLQQDATPDLLKQVYASNAGSQGKLGVNSPRRKTVARSSTFSINASQLGTGSHLPSSRQRLMVLLETSSASGASKAPSKPSTPTPTQQDATTTDAKNMQRASTQTVDSRASPHTPQHRLSTASKDGSAQPAPELTSATTRQGSIQERAEKPGPGASKGIQEGLLSTINERSRDSLCTVQEVPRESLAAAPFALKSSLQSPTRKPKSQHDLPLSPQDQKDQKITARMSQPDQPGPAGPAQILAAARETALTNRSSTSAATGTKGSVWHEVTCVPFLDPETNGQVMLIAQTDVTERSTLEQKLMNLTEGWMYMLENMFPKHILERIACGAASLSAQQQEGDASDNMLHLVKELQQGATHHECVTIMFTDICGFTAMSKEVEPEQVMSFLNQLFSLFDDLVDKHKVYKVETAGDCYIVCAGLLDEDENGFRTLAADDKASSRTRAARRVLNFAVEMMHVAKTVLMPNNGLPVQQRVGVHSGPVVSGLIGHLLPKFALFGDTMNTASRMESTSQPGRIQVSQVTRDLLADAASDRWESTGGVEVKGKGIMDTYLLRESAMGIDSGMPTSESAVIDSQSKLLDTSPESEDVQRDSRNSRPTADMFLLRTSQPGGVLSALYESLDGRAAADSDAAPGAGQGAENGEAGTAARRRASVAFDLTLPATYRQAYASNHCPDFGATADFTERISRLSCARRSGTKTAPASGHNSSEWEALDARDTPQDRGSSMEVRSSRALIKVGQMSAHLPETIPASAMMGTAMQRYASGGGMVERSAGSMVNMAAVLQRLPTSPRTAWASPQARTGKKGYDSFLHLLKGYQPGNVKQQEGSAPTTSTGTGAASASIRFNSTSTSKQHNGASSANTPPMNRIGSACYGPPPSLLGPRTRPASSTSVDQ